MPARSRLLLAIAACLPLILARPLPAKQQAPSAPVEEPADPPVGLDSEDPAAPPPEPVSTCNEQTPQGFLIRGNYVRRSDMSRQERDERRALHQQAIDYRTEQYGYFRGFGSRSLNDSSPSDNAGETVFFGLEVTLNRRITPALACVEAEIRRNCADVPYQPDRLSGLRTRNTFHNDEVSNHVFGIAIDVDPDLNTCCGCTARWRRHPLCRRDVESIFERMAMPECWVRAFERYGFYWLGNDELEDTMHFEFLADPDEILRSTAPAE